MSDEKQQSIIKVYDLKKEVEKEVKKEVIASLQKQQKIINWAMVAVIMVVTLGFVAIIVSVFGIFIGHEDYAAQRYNRYIELLEKNDL